MIPQPFRRVRWRAAAPLRGRVACGSWWRCINGSRPWRRPPPARRRTRATLRAAIETILAGYTAARVMGSKRTTTTSLRAGAPGWRSPGWTPCVDDRPVTPRTGKAVEVQALWINALWVGGHFDPRWRHACERALESFAARVLERRTRLPLRRGRRGINDPESSMPRCDPTRSSRSAVLPLALLDGERARAVVATRSSVSS